MYVIIYLFRERTLGKGTFGKVKLAYHTIVEEYVRVGSLIILIGGSKNVGEKENRDRS